MYLSQFCHKFSLNGKTLLFHALNFEKAILDNNKFNSSNGKEAFLELDPEKDKALIHELRDKKILLSKPDEDSALLEESRAYIESPYITTAYFFLTNDCNLACTYCFEQQSVPGLFKKESMSREMFLKGLSFFEKMIRRNPRKFNDKKTIILYGGEPFMKRELLYFAVEKIKAHINDGSLPEETMIIIVTNGTLLKQADVDFLKKHDITLTFSIDGNEKACGNRVHKNKKPAFDQIIEKYKMCRDAKIDINIACTLSPQTFDNFDESLDYFIEELKIKNIGFNALLDNGIIKIPENYDRQAADFIVKAYEKLHPHGITESRMGRRQRVYQRKKPCVFDCNAQGGRQIAIAPGGQVGICHEHIADRKHFVTDVSQDFAPEKDPVFLEWAKRSPLYIEKCMQCPALGICGGGCVINTESKTNSIWEPDERFCKQSLAILKYLLANSVGS